MISIVQGNLLEAKAEALVNTVNLVGVMGKGIALQFKKAFPENFKAYKKALDSGQIAIGKVFVFHRGTLEYPRYIINFPTKKHWKGKSRLEYIDAGLGDLVKQIAELGITSIAIPPLGCGFGGLRWDDVRPRIVAALSKTPSVQALLFEPAGPPAARSMINRTPRPRLTHGRSAILGLMDSYLVPGFNYLLSLLEIQKLAYCLQESGEPLRLKFSKGRYGPYADDLRHVLDHLEGHYIIGFGEGSNKPETPVELLPGAADEAKQWLSKHPDTNKRYEQVSDLIEGFESPYGLELLTSVHWVASRENLLARSHVEYAIQGVSGWNKRKSRIFPPRQIAAAWNRLKAQEWI